jgi:GNAT superfamily N-acetyltransferase
MTNWQTSLGVLTIERAKPEELGLVMEIVNEAAAWLHSRGIIDQLPSPMSELVRNCTEREISKGEVYLTRLDNGDAVGVFRFEWSDPILWCDDPEGGGYLHSFALRKIAHGHGIGKTMIAWAKEYVAECGKRFLRLDCWGENRALCKYYEELGFTFCGMIYDEDGPNALWQMKLADSRLVSLESQGFLIPD